ncbi:TIGR04282 family arsenosugar biosynthesis glycosyltransferase [Chlorobaculum sp. MV4-Y]|jgi:rSAM/selenodomain-associated transferase 1|uniref:TIGR04282 family arsenosugar biosynthesis glycosyltransferase n=1 Tax=Chlorobaculum sp. MV4-Y TaxID=2976335 RepID=UPI0021AEFB90|nr:TIGR04282 family arsenosugar biosynthesis glycosyltransferase [Chlorobaculum sp. MV4-Y]UWX58225.1 TIGR04282 family arsenosugar biosynthesis glycosyltransferase [Chlorobaculum sp. MV4-Y]
MNNRRDNLLIVFSKNPVAGRVKTRLAASIGETEALRIYEQLRELTRQAVGTVDASKAIAYSDFIPETDLLLTGGAEAWRQQGSDLGERMHRAFVKGFSLGFSRIALIGTDCPEISPFILDLAFRKLDACDVVLGPARDGGFYLSALKRPFPELFLNRTWSTSSVLNNSQHIIREHGRSYDLLPALSDIDTFDDLKASGLWAPNQD